ncbi:MAG: glutamate--tRNA ligase [Rhodobacteraceae bacterium]|nr:glutamate--tRNA ligase [Paracoccaceae bacterium]
MRAAVSAAEIVTRFAPSPTGMLHTGGARTALFNWLFARSCGGQFRLRIEDTDRARSTAEAAEAILDGLTWLGLDWDGETVFQHANRKRHREVAEQLIESGAAYKCFATAEELAAMKPTGDVRSTRSPWRDRAGDGHPDAPYCIRLKVPLSGFTVVEDAVFGHMQWQNELLDDFIIIRSDGDPTYNFVVVVDDHDMGVSHVIRGDDHLANTPKQCLVYAALGWVEPVFVHIPLILDEEGRKLSKRADDPGLEQYRQDGIPARAVRNYLARLGWSHGDDDFFTTGQAIEWFRLEGLRKSPARLDRRKLDSLAGQHIAAAEDAELLTELNQFRCERGSDGFEGDLRAQAMRALPVLKQRVKSLRELDEQSAFIDAPRPIAVLPDAAKFLGQDAKELLLLLLPELTEVDWREPVLDELMRSFCGRENVGFGKLARPVRVALTGRAASLGITDILMILGREEVLGRIREAVAPA